MSDEYKFFRTEEFVCPCCGANAMREGTIRRLDRAREIAGIPFIVTSGYRCESNNRRVGGAKNSAHLRGYGVDIRVRSARERYKVVTALLTAGFSRIGAGYPSHVHADDDPEKPPERMW